MSATTTTASNGTIPAPTTGDNMAPDAIVQSGFAMSRGAQDAGDKARGMIAYGVTLMLDDWSESRKKDGFLPITKLALLHGDQESTKRNGKYLSELRAALNLTPPKGKNALDPTLEEDRRLNADTTALKYGFYLALAIARVNDKHKGKPGATLHFDPKSQTWQVPMRCIIAHIIASDKDTEHKLSEAQDADLLSHVYPVQRTRVEERFKVAGMQRTRTVRFPVTYDVIMQVAGMKESGQTVNRGGAETRSRTGGAGAVAEAKEGSAQRDLQGMQRMLEAPQVAATALGNPADEATPASRVVAMAVDSYTDATVAMLCTKHRAKVLAWLQANPVVDAKASAQASKPAQAKQAAKAVTSAQRKRA